MGDNNDNNGEGGDQPRDNQPWLAKDSLAIPGQTHNLPRYPEKLFPKFYPETSGLPEDHIKKFILAIRLMNVQNEDVVCTLFPYTFENSASTWYFNLPVGSITNWTKFQKDFLDKFAKETTTRDLMAEIFSATMSVGTGADPGFNAQEHTNKALTIVPLGNTYKANEVSPEVEAGVVAKLRCLQP
jgi:hypothetical protein